MRLLTLPAEVIDLVETRKLTPGHAKILVGLDNANFVAKKIVQKNFSVRQTENFVKIFKTKRNSLKSSNSSNLQALENSIADKVGLNVRINNTKRNSGNIKIEYKDLDQLNKIIEIIKFNY